jgi:hypothetical protein
MAVTKETYSATAGWTVSALANMFRDAFIDAGLMTAWHDSFQLTDGFGTTTAYRVLRVQHDASKAYGSSYYSFCFDPGHGVSVTLASGWNPAGAPPVNVPTGTRYLDYYDLPVNVRSGGTQILDPEVTSNVHLDRFTSGSDNTQSWFVLRGLDSFAQAIRSSPFAILHEDAPLHPWLDLDKGVISGFTKVCSAVSNRAGIVSFQLTDNIRRCLSYGAALRGTTDPTLYVNGLNNTHLYFGVGSQSSASYGMNIPGGTQGQYGAGVALPVGRSTANPAFIVDYIPICSEVPWSPFTTALLADDFGVYMHYADNTMSYGDKVIVQSILNEWEIISAANNAAVLDGASASFLARVV